MDQTIKTSTCFSSQTSISDEIGFNFYLYVTEEDLLKPKTPTCYFNFKVDGECVTRYITKDQMIALSDHLDTMIRILDQI